MTSTLHWLMRVGNLRVAGLLSWLAFGGLCSSQLAAQTVRSDSRVTELARYLDSAEIYAGIAYQGLSVFPLRIRSGDPLSGRWATMDDAVAAGRLRIFETDGGGQVPVVKVENRSRDLHVLIMAGELLSGGKQARTVRQDVIVAPGQRVEVPVFCVEKRRWEGDPKFEAGQALLPQSIYRELRQGAEQQQIWDEVARNNSALQVENPTGSLHAALRDERVRERIREAGRSIVPDIPADSVGFVFVLGDRAAGADFFGNRELAARLLPKLLDSYMVDLVIQPPGRQANDRDQNQRTAIEFFERIRTGRSEYSKTPGAGTGLRMQTPGLLGDGVALDRELVHFGVHPGSPIVRKPIAPYPRPDLRDQQDQIPRR